LNKIVLFLVMALLVPAWSAGAQEAATPAPKSNAQALEDLKKLGAEMEADLKELQKQEDWHGFIDRTGKLVIPPRFEDAQSFSQGLAGVKLNGKWGYIDKTGVMVMSAQFARVEEFSEGLAAVQITSTRDGLFGFIDRNGSQVIPPQFSRVGNFSQGLALAEVPKTQKKGFINQRGEWVIPPRYEEATGFSEDLAAVQIGEKWGYIDQKGTVVIPPQFEDADKFSEGLAAVDNSAFINKQGKVVIESRPGFTWFHAFSEGRAVFYGPGRRNLAKQGFMDKTGKVIVPAKFASVYSFSEGLAVVNTVNHGTGFMDRNGKMVIPPQFDLAESFSEGLAKIKDTHTPGRFGFIDQTGKIVIACQFQTALRFSEGLAAVLLFPPKAEGDK
jgi:hypothetical protein